MIPITTALRSSVGKKFLMGVTGLVWVGFVIAHLIGNFLLFAGRGPFNDYAHFLESVGHGALLPVAELFLIGTLLIHVVNGLTVALSDKSKARPRGYEVQGNRGGASQKTLASQTMAYTGLMLLLYLVFHIATFKYGVTMPTFGPAAQNGGPSLYARVVDAFANPGLVAFYVTAMLVLGIHLSHGAWSAFQSLGLNNRRLMQVLRPAAYALAVLLVVGFIALPVTIFSLNQHFASAKGGLF